jgi:hypothetical protein
MASAVAQKRTLKTTSAHLPAQTSLDTLLPLSLGKLFSTMPGPSHSSLILGL